MKCRSLPHRHKQDNYTPHKNSDVPRFPYRLELFVNGHTNLIEINHEFDTTRTETFIYQLTKTEVKVKLSTEEDLRNYQSLLTKHNTSSGKSKVTKYIKGISHTTNSNHIHAELLTQGCKVINKANMGNHKTDAHISIFSRTPNT